jgi:hypothetical protein
MPNPILEDLIEEGIEPGIRAARRGCRLRQGRSLGKGKESNGCARGEERSTIHL